MDLINILFVKALNKGDATKEYVNEAIKALKGEVSADLDTLEELSKALGNDPDFFLTVKNEIDGLKTELVTNKDAATENTRFAIGTAEQTIEVPSMEEFNKLADDMTGKLTEPAAGLAVGKYFRVAALDANGHAVLEAVDAKTVGVQDVQVAGTSVMTDGVANVPIATKTVNGVVRPDFYGVGVSATGILYVQNTSNINITNRVSSAPLTAYNLDYAVKAAMCDGKGAAWTSAEQKAARERMGVDKAYELIEEIVLEEGVTEIVRSPFSFPCTSVLACTTLPIMDNKLEFFMQAYTDTDISYIVGKAYGSKDGPVQLRFEEFIKNGVLTGTAQGEVRGWGSGTVYGVNNAATLVFCEAFTGVRLYTPTSGRTIPAGTNIKIYGVRA